MSFYSKLSNKVVLVLKMYFGHHLVGCLLFRSLKMSPDLMPGAER